MMLLGTVKSNDYENVENNGCFKCSDMYFDCNDQSDDIICPTKSPPTAAMKPKTTKCKEQNTFYHGKPYRTKWSLGSAEQCRDLCMRSTVCKSFVWFSDSFEKKGLRGKCALKSGVGKAETRQNIISGLKKNC